MAHFLRVFSKEQQAPALTTICQSLEQAGYRFQTFPAQNDPRFAAEDWRTLHLSYDNQLLSINLDRSVKGESEGMLEEEVEEFTQHLQTAPQADGKQKVQDLLQETEQIFACYIPDDISEEGWQLVEALLEVLLDQTKGTLQVDGEGFFDQEGELLYPME